MGNVFSSGGNFSVFSLNLKESPGDTIQRIRDGARFIAWIIFKDSFASIDEKYE